MSKRAWYGGAVCVLLASGGLAWLGLMLAGFGASGSNGGTSEWPFLVAKALGFAGFAMFVCGLVACKEAN
ncbi:MULTISPECIES: hypothetical protein [Chromobacterium]|uniref:Uncharacterized protein n=1 Tax=Chromobacterium rhizoryzae TaxID=1778675 RepID=A0AAD0W9T7_9NEIS|nr:MULTISPECIES: hypothetical protein [Chromobacterium]AXT47801.1 hypothetical protein D1345_17195 [Chromobacterium rhizoryzae]